MRATQLYSPFSQCDVHNGSPPPRFLKFTPLAPFCLCLLYDLTYKVPPHLSLPEDDPAAHRVHLVLVLLVHEKDHEDKLSIRAIYLKKIIFKQHT